jgi:hypothetical protein
MLTWYTAESVLQFLLSRYGSISLY